MTQCIKPESLPFIEILSEEEERGLILIEVIVGDISPKFSSEFIKFQNKYFKDSIGLEHLKRFRKKEEQIDKPTLTGILCNTTNYTIELVQQKIKEENYSQNINVYKMQVPKYAPLNRRQFDLNRKVWPINYHDNTDKNIKYTKEQVEFICKIMNQVTKDIKINNERCCNKTIVVDPKTNVILTTKEDTTSTGHPLKHSIMNSIHEVSLIEFNRRNESHKRKNDDEKNYLCQNLDFYLDKEPCVMCAMAMTHSRVRYVFFKNKTEWGALGSKFKIHNLKPLNHHYRVFVGDFNQDINNEGL